MKLLVTLLMLALLMVLQGSCLSTENTKANLDTKFVADCSEVSSETAILIAKGDAVSDYDFESCASNVEDLQNTWKVNFKLKEELTGGCPTYFIRKKDGAIVSKSLPK